MRPFAGGVAASDVKWQVSSGPVSNEPRWRADGRELFFLETTAGTRRIKLMAVSIGDGPNPVGTPKELFQFSVITVVAQNNSFAYAPSADGQHFLINAYATDAQPRLEVLLNWSAAR
jgi:hypothetical protein